MATIRILVNQDEQILIEPVGDISPDDWNRALLWWCSVGGAHVGTHTIVVPPAIFAQHKHWLREGWTRLGHLVSPPGPEIIALLSQTESYLDEFVSLSQQEGSGNEIDFSNLGIKRQLTSFQLDNLRALVRMPNGANFSVPGAGKTSTTLAVWEYLRKAGTIARLLVICPRSAFEAWKQEPFDVLTAEIVSKQFFSEEPIPVEADLLYVNYEQLENRQRLNRLLAWAKQKPTMLVIDEAHRIKGGGSSIRWRACLELANAVKRVDLLTGTPMPQSPEDLRNLFGISWQKIPRLFLTDERLKSLQRGGVFVRTTKLELQLPPMRIETVKLEMSKVQLEIYSALRSSYIGQFGLTAGDQSYFGNKGKAVMSLLACATNPGLLMSAINEDAYLGLQWPPLELSGSERLLSILDNYSSHEMPSKYQWLSRFVKKASNEGRKVLVWSTFIGNLKALQRVLEPYDPALIYGGTSAEERALELAKFRNSPSCSVLLSNPQTLGEGISLHNECHETVYIDRSYNAGLYLQSLDRIHRLGLPPKQVTTAYILQSEGTIDIRVANRLESKIAKLGEYLNDDGLSQASLPNCDGDDPPESLLGIDTLDLNDLFEHLKVGDA
jgi:SNF2 family DNA or RNA helicase